MITLTASTNLLRKLCMRGSVYDFFKNVLKSARVTIRTTRNFWAPVLVVVTNRARRIAFRNQLTMDLDWEQYWRMRDAVEILSKTHFTIQKTNNTYKIKGHGNGTIIFNPSLRGIPAHLMASFSLINNGWIIEQTDNLFFQFKKNNAKYFVRQLSTDIFDVKSDKIQLIVPHDSLRVYLSECEGGTYDYDFRNRIVLDVGAFCGETAVFFASQGAKKLIIYEPVSAHHHFIKRNIELNNINAEIHEEGIGQEDRLITVKYDAANLGFGQPSKGKNEMKIRTKNVKSVIDKSKADIAKFDCEGAEISLLQLSKETLRKINYYIVEVHSEEIKRSIINKFKKAGFAQSRSSKDQSEQGITILYFERLPP